MLCAQVGAAAKQTPCSRQTFSLQHLITSEHGISFTHHHNITSNAKSARQQANRVLSPIDTKSHEDSNFCIINNTCFQRHEDEAAVTESQAQTAKQYDRPCQSPF